MNKTLHIDSSIIEAYNHNEMLLLLGGISVSKIQSEMGIDGSCKTVNKENCKCNEKCSK